MNERIRCRSTASLLSSVALLLALASCVEQEPEQPVDAPAPYEHVLRREAAHLRSGILEPNGPDEAPNRYESRALGIRLQKPDGWVFLAKSALRKDADERILDLEALWELLGPHWDTPLVAMAPSREAVPGVDPIVKVYAQPSRPDESERGMRMILNAPPEQLIVARTIPRARRADYAELEAPTRLDLGDLEAATVRMRYRLESDESESPLVEERLWLARQGAVYWWIEETGPAPLSPELDAAFQAIVDSIELMPPADAPAPTPEPEPEPEPIED